MSADAAFGGRPAGNLRHEIDGAVGRRRALGCPANLGMVEWLWLIFAMSVFVAIAFLIGGQPQGAPSLNPVKALERIQVQGDAYKQMLLLAVYAGSAGFLLLRTPFRKFLFIGGPLMLLTLWCFASSVWSGDPEVSFRRSIALLGTMILGIHLAMRLDLRHMLRFMSYVAWIVLVGGVVLAIVKPSLALDYEGRMRGLFSHKNGLGGFAALSLLVLAALLSTARDRTRLSVLCDATLAMLCLVCMALALSATVVPVLAVGLSVLFAARMVRSAHPSVRALVPIGATIGVLAVPLVLHNMAALTEMLGKDPDISGRTLIWHFAIGKLINRPWLGYGYEAFWEGFNSPGAAFWAITNIGAPHSHNGYLQLAVGTGVIGLAIFVFAVVSTLVRLAWLLRYDAEPLVVWSIAFISFVMVTNFSETEMWGPNDLNTALMVYVVVSTNIAVRRAVVASNAARRDAYARLG